MATSRGSASKKKETKHSSSASSRRAPPSRFPGSTGLSHPPRGYGNTPATPNPNMMYGTRPMMTPGAPSWSSHSSARNDRPSNVSFSCRRCGKSFLQKALKDHHEATAHSREKAVRCKVCQAAFPSRSTLKTVRLLYYFFFFTFFNSFKRLFYAS